MKLILTGHDYSGKSTVLNKIWEKENNGKMSYLHLSYREPTTFEFYNNTLDFSNFIMDRCFLDELIYPLVFRRKGNLTNEEAQVLLNKCREQDIKLVILTCTDDEIRRRISLRKNIEEEPEVLLNISMIKNMYIQYATLFGIPIVDTTEKTPEEIISEIEAINIHKIK